MGVVKCQHPPHQLPSSRSTLNPYAPVFVPMKSYFAVEDFSDLWWDLVKSSPFFRDYWLQDCFLDVDNEDFTLVALDGDLFFDDLQHSPQETIVEEEERKEKDLITLAALKWTKSPKAESPRTFEKVPKIVKTVRANPRTIHQPR